MATTHAIFHCLQACQLGETSDGAQRIHPSTAMPTASTTQDYIDALKRFIKEKQKHDNNLGTYLDAIGKPRIKKDWDYILFGRFPTYNL